MGDDEEMGYVDDDISLGDDDLNDLIETEVPDFRDYKLRLSNLETNRDYVVARFQSEAPDLKKPKEVRIYRDGERTVHKRTQNRKAEERDADVNQNSILKDFSGKRVIRPNKPKKDTFRRKMYPRYLRDWNLEMVDEKMGPDTTPLVETRVLTGSFERAGDQNTLQHAFLLLNDDDTVDLVPLGNRSLYRFRNRKNYTQTLEEVEARQKKIVDRQQNRLNAIENKLLESQMKSELMMGSMPAEVEKKPPVATIENAILQEAEEKPRVKRRRKVSRTSEEVDFEHDFDDDDLRQEGSDVEQAAEETGPRGGRIRPGSPGSEGQASDSEGDLGTENKLSHSGLEMQRLLDTENRSDDDGRTSPRRPTSPSR
ncbi:hypothetical protein NDN08_000512 [Rhodosorus marinus]|uniref:RNA polymerase II-associated factor 1 homolog n=1 Tax=Rhodosorus marinus TaxID=101924 RepID=A0AAV8USB2_9RHOD|nr:hypothetical protein NDN08_000512 [Rhodosorus marinus]